MNSGLAKEKGWNENAASLTRLGKLRKQAEIRIFFMNDDTIYGASDFYYH